MTSLTFLAKEVLEAASPKQKLAAAKALSAGFSANFPLGGTVSLNDSPARPVKPIMVPPSVGVQYGDHPAHNGLWDAAIATKDNFAARLAIAPLVLEARGLDVTPAMIDKLRSVNDMKTLC